LFLPLRKAITGRESGPEMGPLIKLIGKERTLERLQAVA
jgi:glutamyl-tRNA synthetase